MENAIATTKVVRRRFHFSLRAFLLATAALAAVFGWALREARKQAVAVAELRQRGCEIWAWDLSDDPPAFDWLRVVTGERAWMRVGGRVTAYSGLTDADLIHLAEIPNVTSLMLLGSEVTDAGLAHLESLKGLEFVSVTSTKITDAGLKHLRGLKSLKHLELSQANVTDAGLSFLEPLTNLERLGLFDTQVTEAGVAALENALPNCSVHTGSLAIGCE
jgi:hypothetical protein